MNNTSQIVRVAVLASAAFLACPVWAEAPADPTVADLQKQIQALTARLSDVEQRETSNWLDESRTQQIRAIVKDVLADSQMRQAADGQDFGYNKGFFIQTPDKNFRLVVNGFIQARYTFASDSVRNKSSFSTAPKTGDVNGFDFRRARLTFSGNVFTPNLTYVLTGDFAGDSAAKNPIANNTTGAQTSVPTDKNYFQIVDAFVAYRFTDLFNIRIGSFLSPFSREEYLVAGLGLVDVPNALGPFDPQRSLGVSLFGQPIKDKLSYEININNGQCSNTLGRAGEVSTSGTTSSNAGSNDNRLAFYTRLQYAGAGKLSDFADDPDLRADTQSLAWTIGGAFGYESANTTSSAFPSPQGSVTIPVSTITSPGFTTYPLNGDLFRGTVDAAMKFKGLSLSAAGYFQQINENPVGAGFTGGTLPSGFGVTGSRANSSFFETGYFGQAGYMLTKQLELVARVGQFITEGSPNRSEEYTIGANYYLYGENFKIQTDLTYVPNEALSTGSTLGTSVNTQDVIYRAQLQLKF